MNPSEHQKNFVLSALRCAAARVRLIGAEIEHIGVALKGDAINSETAVDWCNEVAPGCLWLVASTMEATR
jgi:hypothetical protein